MVLVLYVTIAMGGTFVLEQAATSLMLEHDRFVGFRDAVEVATLYVRTFVHLASLFICRVLFIAWRSMFPSLLS